MADTAPLPATNGATNGASNLDAFKSNATSAYASVTNGPVAQNVKDQHAKTTAELSNLASARRVPDGPAATGQPLTHYHSFFSELLSWNNPRASAIAYASTVALIFAARYLDIVRWSFKLTWMVLGITVAAEVVGKTILNSGLATQLRPRKYYTIPRETLDSMIGDVHELANFFVIESQRILFAENVSASIAAFFGALLSYYLVKIVPYWGLALIATTTLFLVPLIYTSNQELIDHHVRNATNVVNAQTTQLRTAAQKQATQASQLTKQYMGDYTAKAQDMLRGATNSAKSTTNSATPATTHSTTPITTHSAQPVTKEYRDTDFPAAPKDSLKADINTSIKKDETEPLIAT